MTGKSRITFEERFWSKVDKSGECWLWTAARYPDGYGQFRAKSTTYAHRMAWSLENGAIPDGMLVLHMCNNPPCVNPQHLYLGTQYDNVRDMIRAGTLTLAPRRYGLEHHNGKLTDAVIEEIRTKYASGLVKQGDLAIEYGVTQPQVSRLVHHLRRCI